MTWSWFDDLVTWFGDLVTWFDDLGTLMPKQLGVTSFLVTWCLGDLTWPWCHGALVPW